MLNMLHNLCSPLLEQGHQLKDTDIPKLDVSGDLIQETGMLGSGRYRQDFALLQLPFKTEHRNNTLFLYRSLSQRESIDGNKTRCLDVFNHALRYSGNTTVVYFINFKSLSVINRAELKRWIEVECGYNRVNALYMVTHPQCDTAVFKLTDNKFVVLTNTYNRDLLFSTMGMLWLNHRDTIATEAEADKLIRGDTEAIREYLTGLITARLAAIEARRVQLFTDSLKNIIFDERANANLERQLEQLHSNINAYTEQLARYYAERKELCALLSHLKEESSREESFNDLMLMINMNTISQVGVDNLYEDGMYFTIKSLFKFWDKDDYKVIKENRTRHNNFLSDYSDDTIAFLDEIFVNGTYTLEFTTPLRLFVHTSRTYSIPYITRGNTNNINKELPHPHIYYFDCWGDNKDLIIRAFRDKDYVSAWGLILSVLSAVNITDTPVMKKLVRRIHEMCTDSYFTVPCAIDKDGNAHTLYDLYHRFMDERNRPVQEDYEDDDEDDEDGF